MGRYYNEINAALKNKVVDFDVLSADLGLLLDKADIPDDLKEDILSYSLSRYRRKTDGQRKSVESNK